MIYYKYYPYYFFKLIIYFLILYNCFTPGNKRPKISVFLPIYNKEKYIDKCIESIQKQTLKDIEIVAVNDCSNDKTLEKLINLAKDDDRIKIINNDKNHGLLYSRAMGILNSSGKYLLNIDPDDEINGNDSLQILYKKAIISNSDIITFDIYDVKKDQIVKCKNPNQIQNQPLLFDILFEKNNVISDFLIWNKIIRREIFLKAYENFKKEIYNGKWNYFEDDIWNILVNRYAETKLCLNKLIYIYNYNEDSLLSKRFGIIEFQNLFYRHEMYKKLFSKKEEEKYLVAEYYFLLNRLKNQLQYILLINDDGIKKSIIDNFNFFLNNYESSIEQKNNIINFLKMINI